MPWGKTKNTLELSAPPCIPLQSPQRSQAACFSQRKLNQDWKAEETTKSKESKVLVYFQRTFEHSPKHSTPCTPPQRPHIGHHIPKMPGNGLKMLESHQRSKETYQGQIASKAQMLLSDVQTLHE